MLLKENSNIYHCSKLLILLKNAHVRKLVVSSVEKYFMALMEIELQICMFYGSLRQKGSRPLNYTQPQLHDALLLL